MSKNESSRAVDSEGSDEDYERIGREEVERDDRDA